MDNRNIGMEKHLSWTSIFVLLVLFGRFSRGSAPGCSDGFIPFKDGCYFIGISQWLKVRNADNTCKARGADLVGIETKDEFDFLVGEIERRISFLDDDPFRYSTWWRKQFWTSGRRDMDSMGWRWDQARIPVTPSPLSEIRQYEPLTFTAWLPNEPSRVFEKGVTLVHSKGRWGLNDYVITDDLSFICEKPLYSPSERCPPNFFRFRESCYLLVEQMDRVQARAKLYCNEFAAHLVSINDSPEFDFLCGSIEDLRRQQGVRLEYEEWWTGGSQTWWTTVGVTNMTFVWDTTVPRLTLTPWFPNRPRGLLDDTYLVMYFTQGKWWWYDEFRTSNLDYICEKNLQTVALSGEGTSDCPDRWEKHRESCYYFSVDSPRDRQGAEVFCMGMGGRLVAMETQEEREYIKHRLRDLKHYDGVKWWTGGLPLFKQWVWSQDYLRFTDNPSQHLGWAPGEPNNWDDQENFITLLYNNNKWGLNDVPNRDHISLPFICEAKRRVDSDQFCPNKVGRKKLTILPGTGDNRATLMLDNSFMCDGHVKIWRYYRGNRNGTAYAAVWRKMSENTYRLVKKTTFQPADMGRKTIILRHPIPVAAGDVIGVHFERESARGIITSAEPADDAVNESELYNTLSADIYNDELQDGKIIDFSQYNMATGKRTYALFAKLMKSSRL